MYVYNVPHLLGDSGKKFSRLSAGPHKITICFIAATTLTEITPLPNEFMIDQIGS